MPSGQNLLSNFCIRIDDVTIGCILEGFLYSVITLCLHTGNRDNTWLNGWSAACALSAAIFNHELVQWDETRRDCAPEKANELVSLCVGAVWKCSNGPLE